MNGHESTGAFDVVVIGGSFAGLSAALQLARARRRVLVVDGGAPRNRFAAASHGFLGQDGRTPADILKNGREQLLHYPTVMFVDDTATSARTAAGGFDVELQSGMRVHGERLVLATGIIDELPDVPGLKERWGKSVAHCPWCHGYEVGDRAIGVLLTNALSVHQALMLPAWSANVTFFTSDQTLPTEEEHDALVARGVRIVTPRVSGLEGDGTDLSGVRLDTGEVVPIDALFVQTRTRMGSPLADQLGCAMDDGPWGPVIHTDARKETSVAGVFAAGDAARVPHTVAWAVADGVTAGMSALMPFTVR